MLCVNVSVLVRVGVCVYFGLVALGCVFVWVLLCIVVSVCVCIFVYVGVCVSVFFVGCC